MASQQNSIPKYNISYDELRVRAVPITFPVSNIL